MNVLYEKEIPENNSYKLKKSTQIKQIIQLPVKLLNAYFI